MADIPMFDTTSAPGEYPDDKPTVGFVTPYPSPEGHTTGHAGNGGSADRAHDEASNGKAAGRQRIVIETLRRVGAIGVTWKNLAEGNDWHHGQASGVLSVLHKEGRIACLAERRSNCSIYVLPQYVNDRPTVEHRGTRAAEDRAAVQRIRDLIGLGSPDGFIPVSSIREALEGNP